MSTEFSKNKTKYSTTWTLDPTVDGNFQPLNIYGSMYEEVGYGQGGFGQGGYDAPSINIPGISIPVWSKYPAISVYSALVIQDINGALWSTTVDTTGHLITNSVGSIPANSFAFSMLYDQLMALADINGDLWSVVSTTNGNLDTEPLEQGYAFFDAFYLSDSNGRIWTLDVLPTGNLVTS